MIQSNLVPRERVQTILRAAGNAIYNNQMYPVSNMPEDGSLGVHLIKSFGYVPGDIMSKDILEVLLRAYKFTLKCVNSGWIHGDERGIDIIQMPVSNWEQVERLFMSTFSEQDMAAFSKVCR
jgi:hypothetical protein